MKARTLKRIAIWLAPNNSHTNGVRSRPRITDGEPRLAILRRGSCRQGLRRESVRTVQRIGAATSGLLTFVAHSRKPILPNHSTDLERRLLRKRIPGKEPKHIAIVRKQPNFSAWYDRIFAPGAETRQTTSSSRIAADRARKCRAAGTGPEAYSGRNRSSQVCPSAEPWNSIS